MDTKEKTKGEEDTQVNKARLTVTCKNLKSIEKCFYFFFSFIFKILLFTNFR